MSQRTLILGQIWNEGSGLSMNQMAYEAILMDLWKAFRYNIRRNYGWICKRNGTTKIKHFTCIDQAGIVCLKINEALEPNERDF